MSRLDDDAWLESVWVSSFVKLVICCKKLMMISRSSLGFVCFAAVLHAAEGPTATSQYEHSSIPATVKKLFNLPGPFLTARDAWAGTFESVFSLSSPRTDCPCKKNQLQAACSCSPTQYILISITKMMKTFLVVFVVGSWGLESSSWNQKFVVVVVVYLLLLVLQWSCQLLLHLCDHRQRTKMANCQSFKTSCWH